MELTTRQAGRMLGLSPQAVRNHVEAGRLPVRKHGIKGVFKVEDSDIREFAAKYNYVVNERWYAMFVQEKEGVR